MVETLIQTREELEEWLSERGWLADSFVRKLNPMPRPGVVPSDVTIEIGAQVEGGFEAGESRVLRVFELRADGVMTWQIDQKQNRSYDPEHCLDAVYLLDTSKGVGLSFDVPGRIVLICSELIVRELSQRREVIQPFVSDYEFSANMKLEKLPSPADWIKWLRERGVSAVWRQYAGGAVPAEQVPTENYTGWFLQRPERIADDPFGLFFFHCERRLGSCLVHVQDQDTSGKTLWRAVGEIVSSMPGVEIRSGNCRLNGLQWRQYLKDGYIN